MSSRTQRNIAARTRLQLLAVWPLFDPDDWSTVVTFATTATTVVAAGYAESVAAAERSYRLARFEATRDLFTERIRPEFVSKAARTSLIVTGPVAAQTALRRGANPADALGTAGELMARTGEMHALRGGRQYMTEAAAADPLTIGWERVIGASSPGPCNYCISRTGITFFAEGKRRFTEELTAFPAHAGCHCEVEPVFA